MVGTQELFAVSRSALTGVGRNDEAIAKLAADFKLTKGLRPGLVTVDTYRIAATSNNFAEHMPKSSTCRSRSRTRPAR